MTDMLVSVVQEGTGKGLAIREMPCAGKTGTTNDNKDGWFVGYTRYYTTSVWVGYDMPKELPTLKGSSYPGNIWHDFMENIHTGLTPLNFLPYVSYTDGGQKDDGKEQQKEDTKKEEKDKTDQPAAPQPEQQTPPEQQQAEQPQENPSPEQQPQPEQQPAEQQPAEQQPADQQTGQQEAQPEQPQPEQPQPGDQSGQDSQDNAQQIENQGGEQNTPGE